MENTNPSSPPKSPNSFMNIKICELNALLESLNLTTPPLERDFFYLEGGVRFVELFKEYEIGDLSEGEIEEEEVVEVEKVGVEYFDEFPTKEELAYHNATLSPMLRRNADSDKSSLVNLNVAVTYSLILRSPAGPTKLNNLKAKIGLEKGRYGVSKVFDTAYWGFLGVGTTFDIFQNLHILYLEYGVLPSSGYGVLVLFPSWSLVKCRHRYVVSSLMDTAYWLSEFQISSFKLQNALKDLETGTLQNFKTLLTVDKRRKRKLWFFYQMDTEDVSDRFVAPCFVNRLEAYDGEINLGVEENIISNEYAVKLCLKHEVKRGNKVVKKELIITLRDSFLRITKAINDFRAGTVTIYPKIDLFLEDIKEEEKSLDDWDHLLDFNLDDAPLLGEEELPPFVKIDERLLKDEEESVKGLKIYKQLGREDMKKVDRGITMINHTQAEAMGILTNVLCQINRNKFGAPIYGSKPAPYLNYNDPAERSLAIQTVTNPFWKISVWKKAVSFLGSLLVPLKHVNWKPDYKDISKSVRKDLFRLWVTDKSTEALDPDEDRFGRCLDEYNWVFPKGIEQLADEYEIKIGEKGQVLGEI
ncbi:hypothetical protein Tco_0535650 [Tanacetum coccineum]